MIIGINGKIGSGKDTVGRIIQYLTLESPMSGVFGVNSKLSFEGYAKAIPAQHPMNTWQIKKFAGKLKEICSILTGIPVQDFEKQDVKDRLLGEAWQTYEDNWETLEDGELCKRYDSFDKAEQDGWRPKTPTGWVKFTTKKSQRTVRWLLQTVGTEAMRHTVHTDVWVLALFADYKSEPTTYEGILNRGVDPRLPEYRSSLWPNWIISDMRFSNEMEAVKKHGGITIRVKRPGTDIGSTHPSETSLDNATFDYEIDNSGTIEDLIEKVREILNKENIING